MLQVCKNKKDIFQLCLFILVRRSEACKISLPEADCNKNHTAVVASKIQKILSDEESHFQDEVNSTPLHSTILRAAPCLP